MNRTLKVVSRDESNTYMFPALKDIGKMAVHFNPNFEPECKDNVYTLSYVPEDNNISKTAILRSNNFRELSKLGKSIDSYLVNEQIKDEDIVNLNVTKEKLDFKNFITKLLETTGYKTDWRYAND
jgi:hypothetical protein